MGTRTFVLVIGILSLTVVLASCGAIQRHDDIDIMTGRLRSSRCVLGHQVSDRIAETALSKAIPPELIADVKPEWRRVNTFTGWSRTSPHYTFHGAIGQIHRLSLIWKNAEADGLSAEVKQRMALHVLALWQYSDDYFLADAYLGELLDLTDEDEKRRVCEMLVHLDMPRVETDGTQITRTVFYPTGKPLDSIQGYLSPDGVFIRHGVWRHWYANGALSLHGFFFNGKRHGRYFGWDEHGELTSVETFIRGELKKSELDNLKNHPDYAAAQQLARDESATPDDEPCAEQPQG